MHAVQPFAEALFVDYREHIATLLARIGDVGKAFEHLVGALNMQAHRASAHLELGRQLINRCSLALIQICYEFDRLH